MTPVAIYHCPVGGKFGLPRQSGVAPELRGRIVLEPDFKDANALRGLEEFDYAWLLWAHSRLNRQLCRPPAEHPSYA